MKKIAIITPPFLPMPPVKGGAMESLVNYLLLKNEVESDFEVTVFSVYDSMAVQEAEKYKNTSFDFTSLNTKYEKLYEIAQRAILKLFKYRLPTGKSYIKKVSKKLKGGDFEAVILENYADGILQVKKVCKSKIYLHLHNNLCCKSIKGSEKIAAACDKILTVSQYIKNQVLTIESVPDEKVRVFKNCVDVNKFDAEKNKNAAKQLREKYNAQAGCCLFLYSGRLVADKGVKELIEAFVRIEGDVKLMIVGSGWYSDDSETPYVSSIKDIAAKAKEKIVITGYVNFDDMPKYYSCADVCVVPSIWDDPSPLIVAEANACAKPVIATDSGGIPEKVTDECAVIVKRNQSLIETMSAAMQSLADDPVLREKMGVAGRLWAQCNDVDSYYKNFLDILK